MQAETILTHAASQSSPVLTNPFLLPAAPDPVTGRLPEAPVDPLFLRRWSPRAFASDTVPRSVLDSMLEAARWAPSSINLQPWRFFVAAKGPGRDALEAALAPNNRAWASKAPVLLSVAGGLVGVALGVAGGNLGALLFDLDLVFPWGWATAGMVVCSGIGIVFGYYPAWKASSLDPIEALRYE